MSPAGAAGRDPDVLVAADGTRLARRRWPVPAATPRAGSLLLVHGLGEHYGRYDHVARVLTEIGIEVHAYDHRGFGRSGGARGTIPHPEALLDDFTLVYGRVAAEARAHGDASPPFVLGHSMGGGVVARVVAGGMIAPRGMILSSPALVPRLSRLQLGAALLGDRLFPALRVPHGLPLDRLSHDASVLAALRRDPLVHDRVTPRLVAFMVRAGARAIADAPRCHVPTLLLVAGRDHLVRPEGALCFHDRLPPGVGTLRVYDELYHELFNERHAERERVFRDLQEWLQREIHPALRPAPTAAPRTP